MNEFIEKLQSLAISISECECEATSLREACGGLPAGIAKEVESALFNLSEALLNCNGDAWHTANIINEYEQEETHGA